MAKQTAHSSPEGRRISETIARLVSEEESRAAPSPSQVYNCTRQVWAKAHNVPQDNFPDDTGMSWIAQQSGKLTEPLMRRLLGEAGFGTILEDVREIPQKNLDSLNMKGGEFDAVMDTGNDLVLVEFKRKSAFDIVALHKKGLMEAIPREYGQVQAYMELTGTHRCFYLALNWSRAELTMLCRREDVRYSDVYQEWVEKNPVEIQTIEKTAAIQLNYIENETEMARVPREYDPFKGQFPCTWCEVWQACKGAG